jgi:phosphoserine phosphatase RsbU/P
MIAAMLYASVSTLSSSSNSPEMILAEVETILRNQLGEEHYVTIFYGVLDLPARVLHFVNAGHCPPILRRSNGAVESLAPTRPVLGLALDAEFRSERLRLASGDRLLLYTDGVTEAANEAGEEFGAERLSGVLDSGVGPLPERWRTIMEQVCGHANGKLADDATLLLITIS